jgi:hypothetical protein
MYGSFYHQTRCAIRGGVAVTKSALRRASSWLAGRVAQLAPSLVAGVSLACSSQSVAPATEHDAATKPDSPVVAAQPGAWFDAQGGLAVVGAGRRLRLQLSAPVVACEPAFDGKTSGEELSARASLPFHVLSEVCREAHPSILLTEESVTASPAELEHSYHEVARCAATDLGATSGWVPAVVAASDPCPGALGIGWRLPQAAELQGLTVDDRKAVAGALFEADTAAGFGSLLLYAKAPGGEVTLVTLSPNGSEQPPALSDAQRSKPFFGAALRCVPPASTMAQAERATLPVLPYARECIKALRQAHASRRVAPTPPLAELQKLKAWVEAAQRSPAVAESATSLSELSQLLAAPALERLARDAREERELTEHYAELAEGLDDPNVSAGERERRRAEFGNLRRRLGGQIVQGGVSSGSDRTQLSALLAHLIKLFEAPPAPAIKPGKRPAKTKQPDYKPLLVRLHELRGEKAATP